MTSRILLFALLATMTAAGCAPDGKSDTPAEPEGTAAAEAGTGAAEEVEVSDFLSERLEAFFLFELYEEASEFRQTESCNEADEEEEAEEEAFVDVVVAVAELVIQADDDDECDRGEAEGLGESFSFDEGEVDADDE